MVKGIIYNPNVEDPAKEQSGYMERLWESQKRLTSGEKKHMIIPVNIHIRQ